MISSDNYRRLMLCWTDFLPQTLNRSPFDPTAQFYGTGEKAHWPVQSNLNVAAACAVMADFCRDNPSRQDTLRQTALNLFRYVLRTHKAVRDLPATDNGFWGCHWISVLGLERAAHGIRLLEPFFSPTDREQYAALRRMEAKSILEDFEVAAGPNATGRNHPESNLWNGCFLYRTLAELPDLPNRDAYRDKANRLLICGLAHPSDATCDEVYEGVKVSEAYAGDNFSEAFGLDHHGYLNFGYSVIALSHIAMHYFGCRETGRPLPPALFHNARALWNVVRSFFFPDGRLLRIGGDTRARYTYAQCYAIPVWLLAADVFHDPIAPALEKNWLDIVRTEVDDTNDGSCYSRRLAPLRNLSLFYARRLESDHILSLSYGALWRDRFPSIPADTETQTSLRQHVSWFDPSHAAMLLRTPDTIRSFVRDGAQGPVALCVPSDKSDLAEWQGNLTPMVEGNLIRLESFAGSLLPFENGFTAIASANAVERGFVGEAEEPYAVAALQTACAALPDGHTLLFLQHGTMLKDAQLNRIFGLNLLLPNDVFNGRKRTLHAENRAPIVLEAPAARGESIPLQANAVSVDDALFVRTLGGATAADRTLSVRREDFQPIVFVRGLPRPGSLYAERLCTVCNAENRLYRCGETILDGAFAVSTHPLPPPPSSAPFRAANAVRIVSCTDAKGAHWLLAANFSTTPECLTHAPAIPADNPRQRPQTSTKLPPNSARLLRLV